MKKEYYREVGGYTPVNQQKGVEIVPIFSFEIYSVIVGSNTAQDFRNTQIKPVVSTLRSRDRVPLNSDFIVSIYENRTVRIVYLINKGMVGGHEYIERVINHNFGVENQVGVLHGKIVPDDIDSGYNKTSRKLVIFKAPTPNISKRHDNLPIGLHSPERVLTRKFNEDLINILNASRLVIESIPRSDMWIQLPDSR